MCGNVICGRFDPSKPFFTKRGSFWTNSTTELLASTTEADRQARTRNRCNGKGYESVALIPLRLGAESLGLLQLNDQRKGMFSPETIDLWERLADNLAVALAKCRAEEALREAKNRAEQHGRGTGPLQPGPGAVRLRGQPRPAGAAADGRDASWSCCGAVRGQAGRQGRRVHRSFASTARSGCPRLIKDLLAYSRVGTPGRYSPDPWICGEVARNRPWPIFATASRSRSAVITHDPLPTVPADAAQMAQLFQNLIGNALKFRAEGRCPQDSRRGRAQNGAWVFQVQDNGIGIDPEVRRSGSS